MEAFHPDHQINQQINPAAGGPKEPSMLCTKELVTGDFPEWHMIELLQEEVMLQEGPYHVGKAAVVRVLAQKPL